MMATSQNNSDEEPIIPLELIVGVSAAALVLIVSIIVGVCCWKYRRDAENVEVNPEYGEDYYDKNNYHTKVVDECNYYGDDDVSIVSAD